MSRTFLLRICFCLLLVRLLLLNVVAQAPTPLADSLTRLLRTDLPTAQRMQVLNDLAWAYTDYDSDSTRAYAGRAFQMATQAGNIRQQGHALKSLGMASYNEKGYDDAECYYLEAENLFRSAGDTAGRLSVYNNIGFVYRIQGKCEEASKGYLEGMTLARLSGELQKEGILSFNYLLTQVSCHAYESALETGDSLLAFSKLHNNPFLYAHVLSQVGYVNYKLQNDSLALRQLLEAEQIAVNFGDPELLSTVLNNLGNIYEGIKEYEKAYEYYVKSLKIDEQQAYPSTINNAYHNVGLALFHLKRYEEAIPYMEKALKNNQKEGNHTFVPDTYYSLAMAYAETGRHKDAVQYLLTYIRLNDSLFNENTQRSIQELKQQYETEKLARELANTRLEMEQQQSRNVQRIGWLSGGFATLLAAAGFTVLSVRRRRAELEKRRIELEYQVLRAQMNPHFIFNALNSIQGFFSERDFAQGNEYLGSFGQLMRRVLEQSGQSSVSLAGEIETLHLYLRLEQVRLKDKFHYTIELVEDLDESMVYLPPLIIQPFVENAIWHGIAPKEGPGLIRIRCSVPEGQDELLRVEISDDGVGLKAAAQRSLKKQHKSRGIAIIRERLGSKGSVKIEEITDSMGIAMGTRVLLLIPMADD